VTDFKALSLADLAEKLQYNFIKAPTTL